MEWRNDDEEERSEVEGRLMNNDLFASEMAQNGMIPGSMTPAIFSCSGGGEMMQGIDSLWDFTEPAIPETNHPHRIRSESDYHHRSDCREQTQETVISFDVSPATGHVKEMIYRAAAFRPVNLGAETVEKPKRKNVRISNEPQTVAARQRREKISERIRVLQKLVPGGTKMDTASMLDEAANYLKFLRSQIKALQALPPPKVNNGVGFQAPVQFPCTARPICLSDRRLDSISFENLDHF